MSPTPPKMPSMATVANARDRLEQANFRAGKAQSAAIMSSAVARQDAMRMAEATKERDAAQKDYEGLVAVLTGSTTNEAIDNAAEIRTRALSPVAVEQAAELLGLADGGPVEAGRPHLVGEHTGERFVPATHAEFGDLSKKAGADIIRLEEPPIEVGDTVRLRSGGVDMLVEESDPLQSQVYCSWPIAGSSRAADATTGCRHERSSLLIVRKHAPADQAQG